VRVHRGGAGRDPDPHARGVRMTLRERWQTVARRATPRAILVAAWCVFLLYAYPGYLTGEGVDQMMDTRSGQFTDWHSPAMTQIWSWLAHVVAGSAPMLLLQSGLFLVGAYRLAAITLAPKRAAVAAACVLLAPPVMAVMAVIWRESLMAGLLLAGVVSLRGTGWRQVLGLVCIGAACAVRETAVVAALPLILGFFAWKADAARWQRHAVAIAAWAVVAIGGRAIDRGLADTVTMRPALELAAIDLVGTIRDARADELPALRDRLREAGFPLVAAGDPLVSIVKAVPRILFAPALYLALAITALVVAALRRQRMAVALLASGILYELSWFVVATDAQYRYSHWMIVSTIIALVLVIASWRDRDQLDATETSGPPASVG